MQVIGLGIKMLSGHSSVLYRFFLTTERLTASATTDKFSVPVFCLLQNDAHPLMLTEFIPLNRSPDPT